MKTITGTAYFPTLENAISYYTPYEGASTPLAVKRKIQEGQIHIGKPELKPGERAFIQDNRWHVESGFLTRQQYVAGECSHSQYYAQFVSAGTINRVKTAIGEDRIKKSTNEHFNDIPLKEWDRIYPSFPAEIVSALRACGDYPTLSAGVCIAKEAARQIAGRN